MPIIHDMTDCPADGAEAYGMTQYDEKFQDGDVLDLGNGNTGILVEAWPVVATGSIPEFHQLDEVTTWQSLDGGKYLASYELACLHAERK